MTDTRPVRVMIVDDHEMLRAGLRLFLSGADGLEFVGEAGDGGQAITSCGQLRPDVVLMDMVMPDMDGATATRIIRERFPHIRKARRAEFHLTDREREILALIAEGYSNAQIAEHLTVSLSTVKFHVGSILRQLGVSSRTEAAALAWQHDLAGQ